MRTRRAMALLAAGWVVAIGSPGPAQAAAGGTWGAGQYSYVDGTVCTDGSAGSGGPGSPGSSVSSPLAAWAVHGSPRAYLVEAITSNGVVDSAAPPVPSAGAPEPPLEVAPGTIGLTSENDVATIAYLLSHPGAAPTQAAAVLMHTDPTHLPQCADTSAATALFGAAAQQAGPYVVSVVAPSKPVQPGQQFSVQATVTNGGSGLVVGAPVEFTLPGRPAVAAKTGADGIAVASLSLPVSVTTPAVAVTAQATVAVGLLQAGVVARVTATNPSGASARAIYPAAPTAFSAAANVQVEQHADPVLTISAPAALSRVGTSFTSTVSVAGLRGHAATVSTSAIGPLKVAGDGSCAAPADAAWQHAANAEAGVLADDGTVTAAPVSLGRAGCYATRATVTVQDAVPPISRTSQAVVTRAIEANVTATATDPTVLAPRGPAARTLSGSVTLAHTASLAPTVSVELTGPITPASGDCTAASAWTTASRHTLTATVSDAAAHTDALPGDGTFPYSAPAPAGIGCYRQRVVVTLHDPAGHALAVPADSDSAVFVLRPTVTAAVTQLWTISPQPVLVHVSVDGLFGQPAHVRVRMYSAVADPLGCAHARYRSSASAPLGPSVLVPPGGAQSTVDAQSGPTPAHGCYSVVPEVVLDANPGVTASARPGLDGTTLVAAVPTDGALPPAALHGADTTTLVAFLATGGMTLVLLLGVVALVVRFAWHQRDLVPELGGPPLLLGGSGTD